MRVLHVAEAFGGGLMEVVRLIAERGAAAGHPQAIAYGRRPETPAHVRDIVAQPVELFDVGWGWRTPVNELRAGRRLRAIARSWQPDIVHLHSSFAGVVGGVALARVCPSVFSPHAFASELASRPPAQREAYRTAERLAIRAATVVGALSESEAETARRLGAKAVAIVPNGIPELDDGPPGPDRRADGGRPVVIGIGRVVAQRRPDAVARILAPLRDVADVRWVGGGGEERLGSEEALRELHDAGIEVTGWLPRAEVQRELAQATAYIHWTAIDGMPLSILEAVAAGAVVVASDIPPNRELLDPRQLCASEADAQALLRRVVSDPELAAELRAAQTARSGQRSARKMVDGWLELYARVFERLGR
jgi:glycosyltransferase involved in cell wall biosynthesis